MIIAQSINAHFRRAIILALTGAALLLFGTRTAHAAAEVREIAFPTDITLNLQDNYGVSRGSTRTHEGIDIMGDKMTPLYAAVDARVSSLNIPEKSWGYAITLQDADGYTYHYLHVNNDTPGTDDKNGGIEHAYASTTFEGANVKKGDLIGWMGDSGNAEAIGSHLHFEIRQPDDTSINPYPSLKAAQAVGGFDVAAAKLASPDINTDKGLLPVEGIAPCVSGALVKSPSSTAVYYCGANGKRYGFPNERVYFSWYIDFKQVTTITNEVLASLPLGGNVTYRPGIKMVKIESLPNVYAIEKGGVLRWIQSPQIAASLYGSLWAKKVDDLSDALFTNYTLGDPIVQ